MCGNVMDLTWYYRQMENMCDTNINSVRKYLRATWVQTSMVQKMVQWYNAVYKSRATWKKEQQTCVN